MLRLRSDGRNERFNDEDALLREFNLLSRHFIFVHYGNVTISQGNHGNEMKYTRHWQLGVVCDYVGYFETGIMYNTIFGRSGNDHTTMTAPLPVCAAKLSIVGPG